MLSSKYLWEPSALWGGTWWSWLQAREQWWTYVTLRINIIKQAKWENVNRHTVLCDSNLQHMFYQVFHKKRWDRTCCITVIIAITTIMLTNSFWYTEITIYLNSINRVWILDLFHNYELLPDPAWPAYLSRHLPVSILHSRAEWSVKGEQGWTTPSHSLFANYTNSFDSHMKM